jgi:hypothetical protein
MPGVSRDEIIEYISKGKGSEKQIELARLRLAYSEIGTLRQTFLKSLRGKDRIYPVILPTQVTGRWSYLNPPLSGFPKKCINPACPKGIHRKSDQCWSIRDCFIPDEGTFWIEHDLDAVEHRIYCLILGWKERLEDLRNGVDIHTPVTCNLFNLPLCSNQFNPHTSQEDEAWRAKVNWRGKDDTRRTMSKNFTYGGQYFYVRFARKKEKVRKPYQIFDGLWYNPSFVYSIPNIQSYKISNDDGELVTPEYEKLAIRFVETNVEIQKLKAERMERCRKEKHARTLYGGIRRAYFQSQDAAKELFNSIVQGSVASYINESAIRLQREFPESYLVQNHHDSLKWAFPYHGIYSQAQQEEETLKAVQDMCQRSLRVNEHEIPITATFKIVRSRDDHL